MKKSRRFVVQALSLVCLFSFVVMLSFGPVARAQNDKVEKVEGSSFGKEGSKRSSRKADTDSSEHSILDAEKLGLLDVSDAGSLPAPEAVATGTDQGTESEPNDTAATADPLTGTEGRIRGFINPSADVDYYSFTATAGDRVYAGVNTSGTAASTSLNSTLELRDAADALVESDADDGSFGSTASAIAGKVLPSTGTYYLRITGGATIRPYFVYFAIKSATPTAEVEPNNTIATANTLAGSGIVSGTVNPAADADIFGFTLNAGDTVFIAVDQDPDRDNVQFNARLGFGLFGTGTPNQILLINDASTGSAANPLSESFYFTVKDAGTYYAYVDEAVAGGSATFTYTLNVMVIPQATVPNCTTYTNSTPTPIVDLATSSSTISVPATSNRITDLDVFIDATHTFMQDTDWHLRSPGNQTDNGIITDVGAATVGGAQTTMNWWIDDEAAVPPSFPVSASYRTMPEPSYRLDWFDGMNPTGTWTLDVRDDASGDIGTINSWSLRICESTPDPAGTVTLYSQDFEGNDGGYTHSGTLDEWEYGTPATPATSVAPAQAAFMTCNSGTKCWKTDLDATYEFSSTMNLVSPGIAIPAGSVNPKLSWAMRYQLETSAFDHAWVEVTNGIVTQRVWEHNGGTMSDGVGSPVVQIGGSAGWGTFTADLSAFSGTTVNISFHVDGDSSVNYPGVAIDDVKVTRFAPAVPVGVSGRLTSAGNRAIGGASVTLTEQGGASRIALTNSFGYYQFFNVLTQQNITVSPSSKRYTCAPNAFFLSGTTSLDFFCTGTP